MGAELDGFSDLEASLEELSAAFDDAPPVVVGTNVEYASYVEFGTGPHPITPDDADVLHFEDDGEEVFATRVMHPGTPAQPFLRPAMRRTRSNLSDLAEDAETLEGLVVRAGAYMTRIARKKAPVDTGNLQNSIGWETV